MQGKWRIGAVLFLVVVFLVLGVWRLLGPGWAKNVLELEGATMGTTYRIQAHGLSEVDEGGLKAKVENRLRKLTQALSTWEPSSELSEINGRPAGVAQSLSPDLEQVVHAAQALSESTGGAFDITVGPLVNLWGYGPDKKTRVPSQSELKTALGQAGYKKLSVKGKTLVKQAAGMYVDLSAIAKGYGVDELALLLTKEGFSNLMVEIGGEVRVLGESPEGKPWRIGIEQPDPEASPENPFLVLELNSGAVATSGSYRQFREAGGERIHHIIDPRTGRPVKSRLVAVTVTAKTCMLADGAATALMVMGVEKGLAWVEDQAGLEAMFLERRPNGIINALASSGYVKLLAKD